MAIAVVGFALDGGALAASVVVVSAVAVITGIVVIVAADEEVGAAAMIHPEPSVVYSPSAILDAFGAADLALELYLAGVRGTAVPAAAVVGFASDRLLRGCGDGDEQRGEDKTEEQNEPGSHFSSLL